MQYVFQELDNLAKGLQVPTKRAKPWGTVHAILVASAVIKEPFAAINGDDFYGHSSFCLLADHLRSPSQDEHAMVGFVLRHALSEFLSVTRGVCQVKNGYLTAVRELTKVERDNNAAKYSDANGAVIPLSGDEPVSMNMWGFRPVLFDHLRSRFGEFVRQHGRDTKTELYIPVVVNELVREKGLRVRVLETMGRWHGDPRSTTEVCARG